MAQRHKEFRRQTRETSDASSSDVATHLDDQVNIWRRVGDGEDGGPGQGGGIHVRRVRFQEIFKLLRVEIIVEVLRYLCVCGGRESKVKHFTETG